MPTSLEAARIQNEIHNISDKIRKDDAYRRTIYDLRLTEALVTHAKSTR
jgi:hypothetical protein